MAGLHAWMSEHVVELIGAIASLVGAGILIEQRMKPPALDIGAELRVSRDKTFGHLMASLTISRPASGFYEIETIEALGLKVAERRTTGSFDPVQLDPGKGQKLLSPYWQVTRHGDHQSATFWFWVLDDGTGRSRKSINSQKVIRVRLSIALKSARTLKTKITLSSNRIA
jgi:hypothetical protein